MVYASSRGSIIHVIGKYDAGWSSKADVGLLSSHGRGGGGEPEETWDPCCLEGRSCGGVQVCCTLFLQTFRMQEAPEESALLLQEDEKITQTFRQRSESGAMRKVPGSQPLLALMQKNLKAADHKLALKTTIKHLN